MNFYTQHPISEVNIKKTGFAIVSVILALSLFACNAKVPGNTDDVPVKNGESNANVTTDIPASVSTVDDGKITVPTLDADINTLEIKTSEGTDSCWSYSGATLTFSSVSSDTVCEISGEFSGNIVVDVGDDYKFELEMRGLTLYSSVSSPIIVLSGDEITLTAKKDFSNFIYDTRDAVASDDETQYSAAVYSMTDLEIGGKGELTVISENNNGIHSKDDLDVKKLSLSVTCVDNALKGNDSVSINGGNITLIATAGDCIKTTNTDISSKGNQRGTVTLSACLVNLFAACDGIDAAYDVIIEEDTLLNIMTDKYSPYSEEVVAVSEDVYYIRFTSKNYLYSVQYYYSDADFKWVNAEYSKSVSGGMFTYYYYSFPIEEGYDKVRFFIYSSEQKLGQDEDYLACSDYLTWNTAYDTFALNQSGNSLSYMWTNYTTSISSGQFGGHGGMGGGGNTEKSDHSAKGIKAGNEVTVNGGTIYIKSYDDAIHANNDTVLDNGNAAVGNVNICGGDITMYSSDDGIHADDTLTVSGGTINITGCYEGLEGEHIHITDGNISVISRDDGINSSLSSGTGIIVDGGQIYVYASGDGFDANTQSSYQGIIINGGRVVVICNSNANSSLDTERGYTYNGGQVLAIGLSGGMSNESINCSNFSSVATKATKSLTAGDYLTVTVDKTETVTLKLPANVSAQVIYLGSNNAAFSISSSSSASFDGNGVSWN